MSAVNIGIHRYSEASDIQSIAVSSVIVPVVQIIQAPPSFTNLTQTNFVLQVVDSISLSSLPTANLYYRLGVSGTLVPLGVERVVSLVAVSGLNEIIFTAEFDGVPSASSLTYTWTVDAVPPSVVVTQPLHGAEGISISPNIRIEFSENMNIAGTIAAININPAISGSWSGNNNVFTFALTHPLAYDQVYSITVGTGAQDLAGNSLSAPHSFSFATSQTGNQMPDPPNFDGIFVPNKISHNFPMVAFNVPNDVDSDALHFVAEIATNESFSSGLLSYNTVSHPQMFAYYNSLGNKTEPFPTNGVPANTGQVVFKTPVALPNGQYWFRFFADDRR